MPALVASTPFAPAHATTITAPTPYVPSPVHAHAPPAAGTPPAGVVLGAPTRESSQVLPPRPTGRMTAAKGPSIWRSWPMIVIGVASLAIVAAVVIMVWPDSKSDPRRNALEPPPAPVRMDTEHGRPLPPSASPGGPQGANPPPSGQDPWSSRGGGVPAAPSDPADPDPGDIDSIDPPVAPDPYAGTPTTIDPGKAIALIGGITTHFCDRMKSCGSTDDATDMLCSMTQYGSSSAPTCAAATRCFAKIDAMDCGSSGMDDITDIIQLQTSLSDCMEAAKC